MTQKITCPVCFTKMNSVGHDLVCPECGYKYCEDRIPYTYDDHNHNNYESYNKKTSYSSGYTSSQGGKTSTATHSSSQSASGTTYSYSKSASGSTYSSQGNQAKSTYSSQSKQTSSNYGTSATQALSNAFAQRRQASSSGTYRNQSTKKKNPLARFLLVLLSFYIIVAVIVAISGVFGGLFGIKNSITDYLREFGIETENSTSDRRAGKEETEEPAKETYPIVNAVHVSPDKVLSTFEGKTEPGTILEEILCRATSKTLGDITADDCLSISRIFLFPFESENYAQYALSDGTSESFVVTCTKFDSTELCLFGHLEVFISENSDAILAPGDLLGLNNLFAVGCSNTPVELLSIVDTQNIEYLYLTVNGDLDLRGIEEYPYLHTLSVTADNLVNEDYITKVSYLDSLAIAVTGSPIDYSFLESINTLSKLSIEAPFFTDLNFLKGMPNLTSLEILGNGMLSDISALEYCHALNKLVITHADLVQDFSVIGKLTNLDQLTLRNCKLNDLSWASSLTNLNILKIEGNSITSLAPLEKLPNLEDIYCEGNPIEDYGSLDRSLIKDY